MIGSLSEVGILIDVRPNHIHPISKTTNMKVSIKFATAVLLTAGALIASGSVAQAGEGGAAGAVSVITNVQGGVEQFSAAAAVGKLNAAAATLTTPSTTSASAFGSGGVITLTGAIGDIQNGTINDASYVGSNEPSPNTAQANVLGAQATINATTETVTFPVKTTTTTTTTTL